MGTVIINPYAFVRPAPVILATSSVLEASTSDPFSAAHTIAAGTDGIVVVGGWARNQDKALASLTYGGVAMNLAAAAEDNGETDRAGCYVAWLSTEGGLLTGSQNLVADLDVTSPDNWSWVIFDLQGMNQTEPVAAVGASDSDGSAAKSVTVDTSSVGRQTLVLGGRITGRGTDTPFAPGTNVTEVIDDLNGVLSFFVGKRLDMAPVSFSFACTSNVGTFTGDAMAAAAFKG